MLGKPNELYVKKHLKPFVYHLLSLKEHQMSMFERFCFEYIKETEVDTYLAVIIDILKEKEILLYGD